MKKAIKKKWKFCEKLCKKCVFFAFLSIFVDFCENGFGNFFGEDFYTNSKNQTTWGILNKNFKDINFTNIIV